MKSLAEAYKGRKVLVTGHTGFKGSWLSLWLQMLGAEPCGLSLAPNTDPSHWDLLKLDMPSLIHDIRDADAVAKTISDFKPETIFHLAAQPIVLRSYEDPCGTWNTNLIGTLNLLEAARRAPSVKALVIVTSDKCYENLEREDGYREDARLGGHDPYSASKAAVEILTSSHRNSFFSALGSALVASARAGNVIGGGDWADNRLLPDAFRAMRAGETLSVRHPESTRPWQHVLDCLHGYLMLGARLLEGDASCATAWNFGPSKESNRTVREMLECLSESCPSFKWGKVEGCTPHEANLLHLDSFKARNELGWFPAWDWKMSIRMSALWHGAWAASGRIESRTQIEEYQKDAHMAAQKG